MWSNCRLVKDCVSHRVKFFTVSKLNLHVTLGQQFPDQNELIISCLLLLNALKRQIIGKQTLIGDSQDCCWLRGFLDSSTHEVIRVQMFLWWWGWWWWCGSSSSYDWVIGKKNLLDPCNAGFQTHLFRMTIYGRMWSSVVKIDHKMMLIHLKFSKDYLNSNLSHYD